MKRLIAFLLLLIMPTFVWAEEEQNILDDHFWADVVLESSYRAFYERKVNIETARAICKRFFNIATNSKWSPVKWYHNENNKCYIIDKSICDSNNENTIYEITPYIARYYYNKIEYGKDICEEQVIPCGQVLLNMVKTDIKASIRISGYSYSKIPKEIDVQCSETDDYCVANWPCVDSLHSGENCYSCKKVIKKSETCNPISISLIEVKRGNSEKSKYLTDFDKDCKPLLVGE